MSLSHAFPDRLSDKIASRGINISNSFSVAPQPIPETEAVIRAREQFLLTFKKISNALNGGHVELDKPFIREPDNRIDRLQNRAESSGGHNLQFNQPRNSRIPIPGASLSVLDNIPPVIVRPPEINLFPDRETEPELFLPSLDLDPQFLQTLDVKLLPNTPIQNITELGLNDGGQKCYSIIVLEPEDEIFRRHPLCK